MRRRHKVALRPHQRRERRLRVLAGLAVAGLAALSIALLRSFPRERLSVAELVSRVPVPRAFRVERVAIEGVPAPLQALLLRAIGPVDGAVWSLREPQRVAARLKLEFPCLGDVTVRRDWFRRAVRFVATLRVPAAAAERRGQAAGWLSTDGVVFEAPPGVFPETPLPLVELGAAEAAALPALAQFLETAAAGLPSRLRRVGYKSADEGWEVELEDGTWLLWGTLNWTQQKLARLDEVLGDAGKRFGPGLVADLRYFEDGRILVRKPGAAPVIAAGQARPAARPGPR